MTTIISSKSAKITAGLLGLVVAVAFASVASAATFTTNLKVGSKGADVKNLQILLNSDPATQVAATGAGSKGMETTTFGPATKAAVIKFQNKYASDTLAPAGLTSGTGFVGALTRAKLNTMGGTTTTTTTPTTTTTTTTSGPISVTLSNDNPSASAVVSGQATADLAHFTFSGNGTLSTLKLQRTGISSNSTLANVYLFQGNTRVSDGAAVDSNGGITFNNLGLAVNGSLTLSVRADIQGTPSTAGQIVGVTLIGYTPTGATAMTTANIAGNFMSVASAGTMAGVALSGTQAATANVNAGTMAYTFWSQSVTVSSRAVLLKGAVFKYIGSATTDALANIKMYVNGTAVGTAGTINSATNLLAFDFGSAPVTLQTGASTVEVRADIMKGSNRTIVLSLQNAADLVLTDTQLGVNVALASVPATAAGNTITINPGSITTTIDPSFTSLTTVTGGATGAVIGRFKLQAYGEDVKVSSLSVTPTYLVSGVASTTATINNVALYFNGAQVGSLAAGVSTFPNVFTLGSSLIVTAGTSGLLEVRADIQNASNVNYTSGTITATLNGGSNNYGQGMSSQSLVNVPTTNVPTTGLTIATGALSVAQNAGYATAQTVNPNTANVKLGSYVLQNTSSSESVRITNLAIATSTGTMAITNLSNLRTTETSGSGSTPISPAATNNFSVNFTLAPGQSKTIDVMVDLGAATSGTISTTLLPTATGASSNVTLTPSSATQGQTLTVQTGSVAAAPTLNPAPSSLAAQFVVGGASNLGVAQYNFVATNGVATISELKFLVGGVAVSPITQVCVGGVCAPVVNNVAYLTGLALSVPNSSAGLNVSVTATFAPVGVNGVTSNTTAILNLMYMKYTIGGVTTSTPTGVIPPTNSSQVIGSWTSGATGSTTGSGPQTMTIQASSTNPLKVGMEISFIGTATTTAASSTTVGGLGIVTAVTSATASSTGIALVNWTVPVTGIASSSAVAITAVPSNSLTVVGTKPTVSIAGSTDTLLNGLVKIAEVTVSADAAGDLKLQAFPINITATGVASATSTALTLKGTDGTSITTSGSAPTMGSDSLITITGGYLIPAGTSKTFRVYATAQYVSGGVNTMSFSTKLGSNTTFSWTDLVGNVTTTGALIYNYPTDTAVIHN